MKRAIVFAGGTIENYANIPICFSDEDFVICADSGAYHSIKLGISADFLVGDFDSSDYAELCNHPLLKNAKHEVLKADKDDTDTEHAINLAIEKGYKDIVLVAGTGSRLDHSLSNIFLMEKCFDLGVKLCVINDKNIVRYIKNGVFTISKAFKYISIIPFDKKALVSGKGFKYSLDKQWIFRDSSRTISNELDSESGTVTVHEGAVLVIECSD